MPFDSRIAFLVLIGLVACERLVELVISKRNGARALARGGVEGESRAFYATMVVAHALFLAASPLEVFLAGRLFRPGLAAVMLALAAGAMALRYWAIATLGERWNTRVLVVSGSAAAVEGPYRTIRHPNYLAVIAELFALPLVHSAWLTALTFSSVNALLLRRRIARTSATAARPASGTARYRWFSWTGTVHDQSGSIHIRCSVALAEDRRASGELGLHRRQVLALARARRYVAMPTLVEPQHLLLSRRRPEHPHIIDDGEAVRPPGGNDE